MTLSEENRQASEAFEQRRLSKQILVEVALGPGPYSIRSFPNGLSIADMRLRANRIAGGIRWGMCS